MKSGTEKKWSGSGSWSVGSDLVWPVRKRLKLEVKSDVTGRSNDMTFVLLIEKLYSVRKVACNDLVEIYRRLEDEVNQAGGKLTSVDRAAWICLVGEVQNHSLFFDSLLRFWKSAVCGICMVLRHVASSANHPRKTFSLSHVACLAAPSMH